MEGLVGRNQNSTPLVLFERAVSIGKSSLSVDCSSSRPKVPVEASLRGRDETRHPNHNVSTHLVLQANLVGVVPASVGVFGHFGSCAIAATWSG